MEAKHMESPAASDGRSADSAAAPEGAWSAWHGSGKNQSLFKTLFQQDPAYDVWSGAQERNMSLLSTAQNLQAENARRFGAGARLRRGIQRIFGQDADTAVVTSMSTGLGAFITYLGAAGAIPVMLGVGAGTLLLSAGIVAVNLVRTRSVPKEQRPASMGILPLTADEFRMQCTAHPCPAEQLAAGRKLSWADDVSARFHLSGIVNAAAARLPWAVNSPAEDALRRICTLAKDKPVAEFSSKDVQTVLNAAKEADKSLDSGTPGLLQKGMEWCARRLSFGVTPDKGWGSAVRRLHHPCGEASDALEEADRRKAGTAVEEHGDNAPDFLIIAAGLHSLASHSSEINSLDINLHG